MPGTALCRTCTDRRVCARGGRLQLEHRRKRGPIVGHGRDVGPSSARALRADSLLGGGEARAGGC